MIKFFSSKAVKYTVLILLLLGVAVYVYQNYFADNTVQPQENTTPTQSISVPAFNADSAYAFTAKQVTFGPRVPGSAAHKACADWLIQKLRTFTDTVYVQETTLTQNVSNKKFPCKNIIGVINPQAKQRILLTAHWDSRAFADEDANPANHNKAIDAADDGASGVAVLLELARTIKTQQLQIGVDILLNDVEDMGKSEYGEDSYCLGTQYWCKNPHVPNYSAQFGILLDMVGAKGATFYQDYISKQAAPFVLEKVWQAANTIGYSDYFLFAQGGGITDDHVFINQLTKIPTIDIINQKPNPDKQSIFVPHWHTINDNMSNIDAQTLKAVGQTLLHVLYSEQLISI